MRIRNKGLPASTVSWRMGEDGPLATTPDKPGILNTRIFVFWPVYRWGPSHETLYFSMSELGE